MTTEEKAELTCFNTEGITKDEFSIKYTCFDTEGITYDGFSITYLVLKLAIFIHFCIFFSHITRISWYFCIFFSHITRISWHSNLWLCFIFLFFFGLFVSYVHQLHYKMKCPLQRELSNAIFELYTMK